MKGHCILSHGFESGPDATKVTALAEAAGAFRLAGIGYRATVEQIVKERSAPGRNLYERAGRPG